MTIFRRAEGTNDNFCVFRAVLDSNIGYKWRAPKARAKNLGYFGGRQHMTSFFKFQGGSSAPLAPPASAHLINILATSPAIGYAHRLTQVVIDFR